MTAKSNPPASMRMQKILRLMEEHGIASARDLVGVGETEIKRLEKHFSLQFPKAYRQFLKTFGRSAGFLSPWTAIYFDDLKEIQETFAQYIAQGMRFELPEDALLIANFENTFDYILCQGKDDPEVLRVNFRAKKPRGQSYTASFFDYLESLVVNHAGGDVPKELREYDELEVLDDLMNY